MEPPTHFMFGVLLLTTVVMGSNYDYIVHTVVQGTSLPLAVENLHFISYKCNKIVNIWLQYISNWHISVHKLQADNLSFMVNLMKTDTGSLGLSIVGGRSSRWDIKSTLVCWGIMGHWPVCSWGQESLRFMSIIWFPSGWWSLMQRLTPAYSPSGVFKN